MCNLVRRTFAVLVFLLAGPASHGWAQVASALPPVDSTASISEAQRQVDAAVAAKVSELEAALTRLQETLTTRETSSKVLMLEEKVRLLEERNRVDRTRALGSARGKYTAGYKLVSDMEVKARGLVAAGASVTAYSSFAELTDLRQYAGFEAAFNSLLNKLGDSRERTWLTGLIDAAIPRLAGGATTLASISPLVGAATLSLNQLRGVLPVFARTSFKGDQFVRTYEDLMCGLNTVTDLHTTLAQLATSNAAWTADVGKMVATYPSLLGQYRVIAKAPAANPTDEVFYLAVQKEFDAQLSSAPDEYFRFSDAVVDHNQKFEAAARTYYDAVNEHLSYWQQLRDIVVSRRDAKCVSGSPAHQVRFATAVANIDKAIEEIRTAYLFQGTDRPEYEYFRLITGR